MNMKYKIAWKEGETALYIDFSDRKFAAKNGSLAWRINNPGLIKHHCHSAKKNGSIGTWDKFAIFSNSLEGHKALKEWLQSKTIFQSDLYAVAKHYQPSSLNGFAKNLASSVGVVDTTKVKDLTQAQFESLAYSIETLCGFTQLGNEEFILLPKIAAKIECPGKEDLYLIGKDLTLTHQEAVSWVNSNRLDAVVVHHSNGHMHLRSRPSYHMQTLKLTWEQHCEIAGEIDTLARKIGEKVDGQCIWGFINGIRNTREHALESCNLISEKAGNEEVLSLCNDCFLQGLKEVGVAILLKIGIDTPVVKNAVLFLRHLLALSEQQDNSPVIVFAHSQGAAIVEHALVSLSSDERRKIRIFTFGGWSFIASGAAHPESHNYASVGDLIPRMGSFNLQYLAIRRYEGFKVGLSIEEIILRLAFGDAIKDLDNFDTRIIEKYAQDRSKYYQEEFKKISNMTVVDSGSLWEHSFNNESYQAIVRLKIDQYRPKKEPKAELLEAQNLLAESLI
jgi:hypothetical protein